MYIVKRERGAGEQVLMQDNGTDYYTCLLYYGEIQCAITSSVIIVAHPCNILIEHSVEEAIFVGPFPLSRCHTLALQTVKGTRGFDSKRLKLQDSAENMGMTHAMNQWVSPTRTDPMSLCV